MLVVGGAQPEEVALLLGGHRVRGVAEAPPPALVTEGARAYRFRLSPLEAAAFLTTSPLIQLGGEGPVPVPAPMAAEARATFPEAVNVPLTLIEF